LNPPPLAAVFSQIGEIQGRLPAPAALLLGILTFLVVNGRILGRIVTHAETVVHEGAHALVGLLTGHRVRGVRINTNGGGDTSLESRRGAGDRLVAFVGYIGPSAAGLTTAWLISIGRSVAVLWLGLLLLAAMLLMVRNFFGGIVIVACGALLALIVRYAAAGAQTAIAYGVTWFLLLSAPKVALGIISRPKDVQDARILAGMTFLWPSAWCFLWLLGTIAALVGGGALLI
jgi:hypothetical protein